MKRTEQYDHRSADSLESQVPESAEQREEVRDAVRSYRAPQIFLIGKAADLMRSDYEGDVYDTQDWYAYP